MKHANRMNEEGLINTRHSRNSKYLFVLFPPFYSRDPSEDFILFF